tara:strand:- start:26 stop:136 length:111 start_codon:yes stop_codon:yes gene_type:complete
VEITGDHDFDDDESLEICDKGKGSFLEKNYETIPEE